ncbi:MAG TPA: hypothetical protein DCO89_01290 [Clostridiales bacterium]|nr:hypothetical protein [Clostridiales bacterium]
MNDYIIAVFSLRTSTMQFNSALNRGGVKSLVIETPKAASASCGISVRFDIKNLERAKDILKQSGIKNFVRFYRVSFMYNQTRLTPVN